MTNSTVSIVRAWRLGGPVAGLFLCGAISSAVAASGPSAEVERGQYLATAGDCISCHTGPGGKPFAGGGKLDTPFGYLLAPNITPDDETGIGRWSADDFYRTMHEGLNRHGQDGC